MLGTVAPSSTSSASGSRRVNDAVVPAVRAAIRKVAAWPATMTPETRTTPGHARRTSSPWRTSDRVARQVRAQRDRPPLGMTRVRSTTPSASPASAIAIAGMNERTGDGSAMSTIVVSTPCTTCPAVRSQATARSPRPTSPTSRPWRTPRCTSPSTPPGSTVLRNNER
jgi:hypothetical protein